MKKKINSSKSVKKMGMGGMNDGPKAAAKSGSSSIMDKVASGVKSVVNSVPVQAVNKVLKSVRLKNGGSVKGKKK
jgi:hypothetical protein